MFLSLEDSLNRMARRWNVIGWEGGKGGGEENGGGGGGREGLMERDSRKQLTSWKPLEKIERVGGPLLGSIQKILLLLPPKQKLEKKKGKLML